MTDGTGAAQRRAARPSVLIVEDQRDSRELLAEFLMSVGFHSLMADGLGAALKSLELVTPDLVITDLMMPDGSGADLMLALSRAAKWRDIPVLLVTGSDPARCQEELLRCAARPERILKKPFRLDELLELAEQLIAKRPRDALRDVD